MEPAQLRALIEEGLTFEERIGEAVFRCVLPTRWQHQALGYEAYQSGDKFSMAVFGRYRFALVHRALRGWEGLRVMDIWPGGNDTTPLAYSADMAQLLLEERTDLLDGLYERIESRAKARELTLEEDRGNSPRGPAGSSAEPTGATTT